MTFDKVFENSTRKVLGVVVVLLTCLSLNACKKDAEVNMILATIDSFTTELITRVESNPSPAAGVADAQLYFNARKSEIKTQMSSLKRLRGYQVSDETIQKMASRLVEDSSKVANLQVKYVSQAMNDSRFKEDLDKLVKDYQALLADQ